MESNNKQEPEKKQPEKIYRYKRFNGRKLENRTFTDSTITNEDAVHFLKQLADVYDNSPYCVKVEFIRIAAPLVQKHLEKEETQAAIAAGLMLDDENSVLKVEN